MYSFDRRQGIGHFDPQFVWFADEYGSVNPSYEAISSSQWQDLTFFARPTLEANEQHHVAVARALDQLASPIELYQRGGWPGQMSSFSGTMWPANGPVRKVWSSRARSARNRYQWVLDR
jgi:hypothetical protein